MKVNLKCLPESIYVDGKAYRISFTHGMWLEAAVNKANYPDRVSGKNLGELEAAIRAYLATKEAERQAAKDKVAADAARPLVEAYHGGALVHIRGRHATTGKLLITYVETGKKMSVSEANLNPVGIDIAGLQGLRDEQADLFNRRQGLGQSFYEVSAGLRDEFLDITYRAERDDFMAIYGDYTAVGPNVSEAEDEIERQVAVAALPWVIDRDDQIRPSAEISATEFRSHSQGFGTRGRAEEYLTLSARIEVLGAEIKRADADFDYDAELKRLEES